MKRAAATLGSLVLAGVLLAGGTLAALPGESAEQKLEAGRQVWASASGLAREVWSLVRFMAGLERGEKQAAPGKQAAPVKKPGGAAKAKAQAATGGQTAEPASQPTKQGSAGELGAGEGNANARDKVAQALEEAVFRQLNLVRREQGLPEFRPNGQVAELARLKSIEMLESGVVTHDSRQYGYAVDMYRTAGLPMAAGDEVAFQTSGSPYDFEKVGAAAVDAWLKSRAHRRAILDPEFLEVGVGVAWVPEPVLLRNAATGEEAKMRVVVNALLYTPMENPPENPVYVETPSLREILEEQGIK